LASSIDVQNLGTLPLTGSITEICPNLTICPRL
jgi:hypothetical protein